MKLHLIENLADCPWGWDLLSSQEKARANQFTRSTDRQRYCLIRSSLRQLLAHYINQPATEIVIDYGQKGKPWISTPISNPMLHFNLSHSQDFALFGFRLEFELGVDIERIRSAIEAQKLARRFFTPNEYQFIQHQTLAAQPDAFFQLWTRKESCIKASGESLFDRIRQLEMPLGNDCTLEWMPLSDQSLYVKDIEIDKDYKAAIATVKPTENIICREWCPQ